MSGILLQRLLEEQQKTNAHLQQLVYSVAAISEAVVRLAEALERKEAGLNEQ